MSSRLGFGAAAFSLLLAIGICRGQDAASPPAGDKAQIEAALKLTKEASQKYDFAVGQAAERAELMPEPVLRWSNPTVGEIHGNVFLWTVGGRPAVVSSIFKWFSPHTHMSHEFHSLSEQPVRGKYEGAEKWVSEKPGVRFVAWPEAPQPAAGKAQRLSQMRDFLRACSVTKRERDGNITEMRLLTQPIYRYEAPQQGLIDGALFVFVQGTDPELFLLLEDREVNGKPQWLYAPARMNSVAFDLKHREKSIWSVEIMPTAEYTSHREAYTTFMYRMP